MRRHCVRRRYVPSGSVDRVAVRLVALFLDLLLGLARIRVIQLNFVDREVARLAHRHVRVVQVLVEHRKRVRRRNRAHGLSGLVAHHRVLFFIGKYLVQARKRARVLQLAEHIGHLMLEQRRVVGKAFGDDLNHALQAVLGERRKTLEGE